MNNSPVGLTYWTFFTLTLPPLHCFEEEDSCLWSGFFWDSSTVFDAVTFCWSLLVVTTFVFLQLNRGVLLFIFRWMLDGRWFSIEKGFTSSDLLLFKLNKLVVLFCKTPPLILIWLTELSKYNRFGISVSLNN